MTVRALTYECTGCVDKEKEIRDDIIVSGHCTVKMVSFTEEGRYDMCPVDTCVQGKGWSIPNWKLKSL